MADSNVKHFRLSLGKAQKDFINILTQRTDLRIGPLVWQSVLYKNTHDINISFLNKYLNFIYDKKHGISVSVQKIMTSHNDLKNASQNYKKIGYNIGIKGVVLLYLLNYACHYLKMDISQYENFNSQNYGINNGL